MVDRKPKIKVAKPQKSPTGTQEYRVGGAFFGKNTIDEMLLLNSDYPSSRR
jgi:hypothetical protein